MKIKISPVKESIIFSSLGLVFWAVVAWLFVAAPLFVVNRLPDGLPLSVLAFLLFAAGLLLLTLAGVSVVRSNAPRFRWTVVAAASLVLILYNLSPLAPPWDCFGKRLFVATVNAAGQDCTEVCTNNKLKPCSGWSSCWDKNVSCSASGIDQDGRPCQGCCFSCDVVCEPEPDADQPPAITAAITCSQQGRNGWCIGTESLELTASDPQGYTLTISGSIAGTPFTCAAGNTCSKSLPEGNGTIQYKVKASQSGKSASGTAAWKRDATPPGIAPVVPPPSGVNGWFTTVPVTLSAGGSDEGSGLAEALLSADDSTWQSSLSLEQEGVYTIHFMAVDHAGNQAASTGTVSIDTTPPTFTLSTAGTMGTDPWYVSPATITISPADLLSGPGTVEYNQNGAGWQNGSSILSNDGVNTIALRVYDKAGNLAGGSTSVSVDTIPPTITPSIAGTSGSNGWWISAGTLSAVVTDVTSGAGGGAQVSVDNSSAWQDLPVSLGDGAHHIRLRAFDGAGNEGSASLEASIDTTAPGLEFVFNGTSGLNGWYVSQVNVSAGASDALSGVATSEVRANGGIWSLQQTLSEGVHELEARAVDRAGNTKSISERLRIDIDPPRSLFTSHANHEVVNGTVELGGRSSDALSGLQSVEVSTDGGTTWNAATLSGGTWSYGWDTSLLPNGSRTVRLRAMDGAGNRENPGSLMLLVDNLPPHVAITDSWWIWESGSFSVSANGFPVREIKVTISDPQGRWPAVVLSYDPDTTSADVTWDRRFHDGTLAPSGNYPVTVLACDRYDNCASDRGVIQVPFIAPIPPTATPPPVPSATPVSSMTAVPSPIPQVRSAVPQAPPVDPVEPERGQPAIAAHKAPMLPILAVVTLACLMWALSSAALADPRPRAIHEIARTLLQKRDRQS